MKKKILSLLFIFAVSKVFSQSDIIWEKKIEHQKSNYLYNAIPTPDYGILLLGSTLSSDIGINQKKNNGQSDFYLVKIDEDGKIEWENSYGGNKNDKLLNAKPTSDGGFILIGSSNSDLSGDKSSENLGQNDIWIIKVNPEGKITWDKTIGGIGDDIPIDVIQTYNNEFIIAGNSNSPNFSQNYSQQIANSFLIKLDHKGKQIWEKKISTKGQNNIKKIFLEEDKFIVFGNDLTPSKSDIFSMEIDEDGHIVSENFYNDNYLIHIDKNNNQYYLTSRQIDGKEILSSLAIMDENLNQISTIKLEIKENVDLKEVYLNEDHIISISNSISTLENKKSSKLPESYFTYEFFDLTGKKIYSKKFGIKGFNYLEKSLKTRDNSILLFGSSSEINNNNQENSQLYLVKLGDKSKTYTRKTIESYPNPTKDYVNILINEDFDNATIDIYNLNGQFLKSEKVKFHSTAINLNDYPSGVYIINVKYDEKSQSIKVIKN